MALERLSGAGETIIERHILVMYGSNMIGKKIKLIEDMSGLKYIHLHEGTKQTQENRRENYNGNMKIKPGVIYKFGGKPKGFDYILSIFNNLNEKKIKDKN
jgi:hypothetical protein